MKTLQRFGLAFAGLFLAFYAARFAPPIVHAQAGPISISVQSSITHTSCPTATAGTTILCVAGDGVFQSINGAAYVALAGATTANAVLSINGHAPASGNNGNLTLTVTASAPAATAVVTPPTISGTTTLAAASTPVVAVTNAAPVVTVGVQ